MSSHLTLLQLQEIAKMNASRCAALINDFFNVERDTRSQNFSVIRESKLKEIDTMLSRRGLHRPLDVALVGATGVGKSSTINALFGETLAVVGTGVAPETQVITEYQTECFRLHDTAGLGDGLEADKRHARHLSDLLLRTFGEKKYHLIDLCLVILDGASRDLGTAYKVLESIVLKCISPDRVIVAINQADMAMKGQYWNTELNCPEDTLQRFLNEKAVSVKKRIYEATGLMIKQPVCYSAEKQWNLDKLMDHIISSLPSNRRTVSSSTNTIRTASMGYL